MTPVGRPTTKAVAYAGLAAAAVLAAVVTGDPALIALGAPFAIAVAIGLTAGLRAAPSGAVELDSDRVVEGTDVLVSIDLAASARPVSCAVAIRLPPGLDAGASATSWPLDLAPGGCEHFEVRLRTTSFARYELGPVEVRIDGPFGCRRADLALGERRVLEVLPITEPLRSLARARDVRAIAGDQLARRPGDGIEFSEVQPLVPGGPGRLNWRVTARRGAPHVTMRTPERSTDVVILVDTFSELALGRQVRAAAAIVGAHLRRNDRVGLVGFGGVLQFVEPATGRPQLERLVTTLAATTWHHSYAWKHAESIPPRMLPRSCLVVALTPLDDPRFVQALAAIRGTRRSTSR